MRAKSYQFTVIERRVMGDATLLLRVRASASVPAHAGQFLSVNVQGQCKRAYSFSNTLSEDSREFELCVRIVEGGVGSNYLASLRPGDEFEARAPFGHFLYETSPSKAVCFIASGTGVAPLRAMALSEEFQASTRKAPALAVIGYRVESDLIYAGDFELKGVKEVHAISRSLVSDWIGALGRTGYRGRVTDYLRSPEMLEWPWLETDFYMCGNGAMIESVRQLLVNQFRVDPRSIRAEAYFTPRQSAGTVAVQSDQKLRAVLPPPFRKKVG